MLWMQKFLKFTGEQKLLDLLLGQWKQSLDKHDMVYEENIEIIFLKPYILGRILVTNLNKKSTYNGFICAKKWLLLC